MMTAINELMLAAGGSLAGLIVIKVTVVAALGLAVAWLARRNRAAVRHSVLAVTFGAMLVLPIASIVAPPVHVTVPVAEVSRVAWPLVVNNPATISPDINASDGAHAPPAAPRQSSTVSLSLLLLAGWIFGTAVFLVPVMTGLWQIRFLRRSGLPWLDGQSIAEALALDAGIHRRVEVLLHEALPGPITCGVLQPAIMLPREAESWARDDVSRAIVHELEHVRRGDSATRCLARAVCALYWFHPLTWIAWRKLVLEAERSCDDAVLGRSDATAYADQLVELAKRLPTAHRSPLLAMANRSDLAARVGSLLDAKQRRGRVGVFLVTMACAGALVLITVISPLVLAAEPQSVVTVLPAKSNTHAATHEPVPVQTAQVQAPLDQPTAPALGKQNPQVGELQFEVASVKPVAPVSPEPYIPGVWHGGPGTTDPGRITYSRFGLRGLLVSAYGVQRYQVIGPDWLDSERFEIAATIRPGATKDEVNAMLRNLLTDRFHVSLHHETRDLPVYELTVAKTGAKLKASVAASLPATPEPVRLDKNGAPQFPPGAPSMFFSMRGTTVHLTASTQSISSLASFLFNSELRVPVIDKTGITGSYDFTLDFVPEPQPPSVDVSGGTGGTGLPSQSGGPDIFVALQEQLGLRLEQKKGPVDVLVVDHADKVPVGN